MLEQLTHDSSHVVSSAYDSQKQMLMVMFKHQNARYVYMGINPSIYQQFKQAKSVGSFVNNILKPNFRGTRVS